jgi:SAM-dependent methyltransferase
MDEATRRRAAAFGAVADTYARVRPGYPAEAVAWLLPEGARYVLDMGAGTGALTAQLVSLGLEVLAVEPDPEMRRVLEERVPRAEVRAGRAEALPVGDGEVDAVLGAQMWHWVEAGAATSEVARVLRPGGVLGLLWNLRDERVPWMAAMGEIVRGEDVATGTDGRVVLPAGAPFEALSVRRFPWHQDLRPSDLVDLMATRSQVQVLPPEERRVVLDLVAELSRNHPDLVGREVVEVPYVTACFRAVRRAGADPAL